MNECNRELQEKIDEHRSRGIMCDPSCWCWSAQGTICLYLSVIETNKLLCRAMAASGNREEVLMICDHIKCCCKCQQQVEISCSPTNHTKPYKGSINKSFGYGCKAFLKLQPNIKEKRGVIFNQTGHGMCELFQKEE